jgi:hypothetical protein
MGGQLGFGDGWLSADFVAEVGGDRGISQRCILKTEPPGACPAWAMATHGTDARRKQRNMTLRNVRCGHVRRVNRQPCEAAEVLGDCCERELELGACRPSQPQSSHSKDALQVRE